MDMKTKPVYKPGDRVIIRDFGLAYAKYSDWFEENGISARIAARYQYDHFMGLAGFNEGDVVTVVAVGVHHETPGEVLLAVEDDSFTHRVWLINARGVEPETKMYNVRVSIPMQIRAKSFEEANDTARFYLAGKVSVPMSDMEVYEE